MSDPFEKLENDVNLEQVKLLRSNIFVELKNCQQRNFGEFKNYLIKRGYQDFDKELILYDELDGTSKASIFEKSSLIDRTIEYMCVSVDKLHIHASGNLVFYNCLIKSDIYFKVCESLKIEFDSCIILGSINMIRGSNNVVLIRLSNINSLSIQGINNSKLNLNGNRLLNLNIKGVQLTQFMLSDNLIEYYRLRELEVVSKNYNEFNQFNIKHLGCNVPADYDVQKFCIAQSVEISADMRREKDNQQTIDALLELTSISYDKEKLGEIKYKKSLLGNNILGKAIVIITAGFRKPSRWFIYACLTIFVFSIMYTLPFSKFDKDLTLNFGDAMYFSCITFSTVGYGDIIPLEITRVLSAFEGILGVSIMAGFITSLASKYTA